MTPTKVPMDVTDSAIPKKLTKRLKKAAKKIKKFDRKLGTAEQRVSELSGKATKARAKFNKIQEAIDELTADGKKQVKRAS